jgi:hypothetical protein
MYFTFLNKRKANAVVFLGFLGFLGLISISIGLCGVAFYTANANRKAKQGAKKHA